MNKILSFFRSLFELILVLALAWGIGFYLFVQEVSSYHEPVIDDTMVHTDAVVVLTGGSERVPMGLNLLRAGKAEKLLITGVHPNVKLHALLPQNDSTDPALQDCCIILGHEADNTVGNVRETKAFMMSQHYKTLWLVTSNYHMPRSLMLFRRQLPGVAILPYAVSPDILDLSHWWMDQKSATLLAEEYTKFLFAIVRAPIEDLLQ